MKAIYHGHSFVQIQINDFNILIDPFISGNPLTDVGLDYFEDKNIKAIIVTHGHSDHIGDTDFLANKYGSLVISTFEICNYLSKEKGVKNVYPMNIGGEADFGDFKVKLVNAVHSGGVDDIGNGYFCAPSGIIVKANEKSIYHAGDTALSYDMKLLGDYYNIDLAFLPIGGNFTMTVNDAVLATKFIKPKTVVPIHYNTWDIIKADPIEFARLVMLENASIPKVLNPGQFIVLD